MRFEVRRCNFERVIVVTLPWLVVLRQTLWTIVMNGWSFPCCAICKTNLKLFSRLSLDLQKCPRSAVFQIRNERMQYIWYWLCEIKAHIFKVMMNQYYMLNLHSCVITLYMFIHSSKNWRKTEECELVEYSTGKIQVLC